MQIQMKASKFDHSNNHWIHHIVHTHPSLFTVCYSITKWLNVRWVWEVLIEKVQLIKRMNWKFQQKLKPHQTSKSVWFSFQSIILTYTYIHKYEWISSKSWFVCLLCCCQCFSHSKVCLFVLWFVLFELRKWKDRIFFQSFLSFVSFLFSRFCLVFWFNWQKSEQKTRIECLMHQLCHVMFA